MNRLVPTLAILTLLLAGGPAFADTCTLDVVPAATLLVPYFEVDLDDVNGVVSVTDGTISPKSRSAIR